MAPPQLSPMIDHNKIMCCCAICNTSNYFQESLTTCWRKQLKIVEDKEDNSQAKGKDQLTQAYKSYANYASPNDETCHPCCENAADSVLRSLTNDECQFPNWKCVVRKCNVCTSIALPGVKIDSSN